MPATPLPRPPLILRHHLPRRRAERPAPPTNATAPASDVHPAEEEVLAARLAELDATLKPTAEAPSSTNGAAAPVQAGSGEPTSTEILVKGLGSFGAITGFRQALAGVDGIEGVSLSLGPTGEFVFRAIHPTGFDVAVAIAKLEGDAATIEHAARRRPAGHPRPRPLISLPASARLADTAMTVRSNPPSDAPERRRQRLEARREARG